MTRILVVDDHPIVRLGIRQMISAEPDSWQMCSEAESAAAALDSAKRLTPDMALVDLSLAQGTGLDLLRSLRELAPGLLVSSCRCTTRPCLPNASCAPAHAATS